MTVPTEYAPSEHAWTGVEGSFAAGFRAQQTSHVKVTSIDSAGAETVLTENVHYSVAIAAPSVGEAGAVTVTPIALPSNPATIRIEAVTPPTQTTNFKTLGAYAPATHEKLHDAAALRSGEHGHRIGVLESAIAGTGIAFKGGWDASSGSFPSGAKQGDQYIVTTAGTVDSVAFALHDTLIAVKDSASTTTFSGNWLRISASDVVSVAGRTGAVTLLASDILAVAYQRLLARDSSGEGAAEEVALTDVLDWLSSTDGHVLLRGASVWAGATATDLLNTIASVARGDILFRGATTFERLAAGTANQALLTKGAGADPAWGFSGAPHFVLEDQKSQNTNGGTATSGAWRDRDLNTELYDPDGLVSLASNLFTLGAGTWVIGWRAPASQVERHQARLYNNSDSSVAGTGDSGFAPGPEFTVVYSQGLARLVLGASKAFKIQHRVSATVSNVGFGRAANLATEIYTRVWGWKTG